MFILICRYNRVFAYPGDDITLSSHLSPETSAVSMEVRWFRGTECIYLYKNGQVSVGRGFEGRASLLTQELKRGNVSLILKSISPMDTGTYSCQVLTGHNKVEKSVHLYMSGMEPLSPDKRPKLTEQDSVDMEESVLIFELKKLLQQREKELQDKTRELESTTEMLRTKSSLLLYTDIDLENMSKLANRKEEHLKNMASELETCKRQLETLGQKLQEKNTQVEKLRVILQDKERELEEEKKHLGESEEQQITEGLKSTAQDTADTEESVHLLELKNLLQNKEEELEDKTKQLESTTGELMRMTKLLQCRDTVVENLAKERDEYLKNMAGEMEMCLKELETLGQKLQEKNTQVEELRVILQDKERELEEEKKRQGEQEHVITVNKMADVSHGPVVPEILEKSDDMLSKMFQNPKEQLEEIESWIYKKREERRLSEEEERAEVLEKEFLDYVSMVKELIGKKHEKIVAWAKMMAVLQHKLEVVETDEEREALEIQMKEALEMQRQGEEEIERLTEGIEEKRSGIEEKHKHEIEKIREKYSTVSKIEAETNILKIIVPDVQAYFQNIAANMQRTLDAQRQIITNEITGERRTPDYTNVDKVEISVEQEILENQTNSPVKKEVTIQAEVEVVRSIKSSPEISNNCVETLVQEDAEVEAELRGARELIHCKREDTESESEDESNQMVNGVIIEEREIEAEIEEGEEEEEEGEEEEEEEGEEEGEEEEWEEGREVNEHVETG
ncbi:golgin subfamily A member 6-like protein 25 isoform X2 [Pangasianodon hypophthalmus]|uniref:golgin subfamily A member 6-like protein 25 isoform X2 n=1 Tax=Pangasianodon hypophthalmus TaxID=310915 RepID=UPI002307770B|nr:golgin subfamily A member 6-like protein 25 isoform X2 [Pangasianodon hypophthalmus]